MPRAPSLTVRLTVLFTLVSVVVLLGLAGLVTWATERHFVDLDRVYLQDKIQMMQHILAQAPQPHALTARLDALVQAYPGLFVQIEQDGQIIYAARGVSLPAVLATPAAFVTPLDWSEGARQLRGMSLALQTPTALGQPLWLLVALDTHHHTHFMHELRQHLLVYVLLATGVSGVLGWSAARRGLAPLRIMKERARAVSADRLDQRMPVQAVPVELADLAASLNAMFERLQADFLRLSEFSSDLAHELRTPISNLLTQTQVTLGQPREAQVYRDILASNVEELQRLARMVSDMLFLAKTEHGLELPQREQIALADEVQAVFGFYEALAQEKQLQLRLSGQALVYGDRLMLRRAIGNLLSNAIRHSPPQAAVVVRLSERDQQSVLVMENTGPALTAEDQLRIFDRFYRVDKARTHPDCEGAGLGLPITRAIMRVHGAEAAVTCAGSSTRFVLTFPRAGSPARSAQA
ncbi:heavy metal sensor histidine kinase [Hydrogenophaga sp.]|uniref:heavy metal sensor histidine kinase n=1 Tax=Hydrogenophaga sp. TaxID=1904254 RepID=UPI0019BB94FD|nr:heavy metal sensor histidine kinase [Hydrogenophaga sp.]MBD3894225.1 heavy metal sensor histidine kinase [Hydrogenophaga sp.]